MKNIIPIIVTLVSVATFVLVVQPQYAEVQELQAKGEELDDVLDNARTLRALRDNLLEKEQSLQAVDIARLEKLIPDSADNVRLILEFEQIAGRRNLEIAAAAADKEEEDDSQNTSFDVETNDYGVVTLDFTIEGDYQDFILFLKDIEKNLRITDIKAVSISPNGDSTTSFSFDISVDTYWLKDNL